MVKFVRFNPETHIPYKIKVGDKKIITLNKANVTVAYECIDGGFNFGVSFCSPLDQFCRKTGREYSIDSMVAEKNYEMFKVNPGFQGFSMRYEIENVLQEWSYNRDKYRGNVPNWFNTFIKNMLVEEFNLSLNDKNRIPSLFGINYLNLHY